MKKVLSLWLLIFASVCLAQTNEPPAKVQTNQLPDKITVDGVTYENVRWQKPTPASVEIFHKSGIAKIPLWKLPKELQERFGYDSKKAAEFQGAEQQAIAARIQAEKQKSEMSKLSKTLLTSPIKVGMVGASVDGRIFIVQIIGPNEMIAKVFADFWSVQGRKGQFVDASGQNLVTKTVFDRPYNIVGPDNLQIYEAGDAFEVWMKGVPTEGLVDGNTITRSVVFKVTGTTTYPTAMGGGKTIFVLEPLRSQ